MNVLKGLACLARLHLDQTAIVKNAPSEFRGCEI